MERDRVGKTAAYLGFLGALLTRAEITLCLAWKVDLVGRGDF